MKAEKDFIKLKDDIDKKIIGKNSVILCLEALYKNETLIQRNIAAIYDNDYNDDTKTEYRKGGRLGGAILAYGGSKIKSSSSTRFDKSIMSLYSVVVCENRVNCIPNIGFSEFYNVWRGRVGDWTTLSNIDKKLEYIRIIDLLKAVKKDEWNSSEFGIVI